MLRVILNIPRLCVSLWTNVLVLREDFITTSPGVPFRYLIVILPADGLPEISHYVLYHLRPSSAVLAEEALGEMILDRRDRMRKGFVWEHFHPLVRRNDVLGFVCVDP